MSHVVKINRKFKDFKAIEAALAHHGFNRKSATEKKVEFIHPNLQETFVVTVSKIAGDEYELFADWSMMRLADPVGKNRPVPIMISQRYDFEVARKALDNDMVSWATASAAVQVVDDEWNSYCIKADDEGIAELATEYPQLYNHYKTQVLHA